jgi:acyl-coenzyme A thioesterase 13
MQNPKLSFLQSAIGKEVQNHPVPVGGWLNGIVQKAEHGIVQITYIGRKEMDNGLGLVQGGILVTMIDDAMAAAVFSLGGAYHFNTITLHTEYLFGAKIGDKIIAKAQVIREGKTIIFVECSLFNIEDKLLTKATSTIVVKSRL